MNQRTYSIIFSNYTGWLFAWPGRAKENNKYLGNRGVIGTVEAADATEALVIWRDSTSNASRRRQCQGKTTMTEVNVGGQMSPAGVRLGRVFEYIVDSTKFMPYVTEVREDDIEIASSYFDAGMQTLRIPKVAVQAVAVRAQACDLRADAQAW